MKKTFALGGALMLTAAMAGTTWAAGNSNGTGSTSGSSMHMGSSNGSAMTMSASNGSTMGTGSSSTYNTGMMNTRDNTFYSANGTIPSVVPRGATTMSTTNTVGGTMVMYRYGNMMYSVTYAPNGSYTYRMTSMSTMSGATSGTSGTGTSTTASTYTGASTSTGTAYSTGSATTTRGSTYGVSALPATGGAPDRMPAVPALLGLLALALVGAGLGVRRLSRLE